MRKVFLEKTVLEPVYKFDEKSYREKLYICVCEGRSCRINLNRGPDFHDFEGK